MRFLAALCAFVLSIFKLFFCYHQRIIGTYWDWNHLKSLWVDLSWSRNFRRALERALKTGLGSQLAFDHAASAARRYAIFGRCIHMYTHWHITFYIILHWYIDISHILYFIHLYTIGFLYKRTCMHTQRAITHVHVDCIILGLSTSSRSWGGTFMDTVWTPFVKCSFPGFLRGIRPQEAGEARSLGDAVCWQSSRCCVPGVFEGQLWLSAPLQRLHADLSETLRNILKRWSEALFMAVAFVRFLWMWKAFDVPCLRVLRQMGRKRALEVGVLSLKSMLILATFLQPNFQTHKACIHCILYDLKLVHTHLTGHFQSS